MIKHHGGELIAQGDIAAQLVALESIVAGLLSAIMLHNGKSLDEAGVYLSAVTHAVRGRLPTLIPDSYHRRTIP